MSNRCAVGLCCNAAATRLKILCLSRHLDLPIYRAVDAALDAAFKAEGVEPWEVVADPTLKELLSLDP